VAVIAIVDGVKIAVYPNDHPPPTSTPILPRTVP
jgi:hypothetical protein